MILKKSLSKFGLFLFVQYLKKLYVIYLSDDHFLWIFKKKNLNFLKTTWVNHKVSEIYQCNTKFCGSYLSGNCPLGEVSVGELSVGEVSVADVSEYPYIDLHSSAVFVAKGKLQTVLESKMVACCSASIKVTYFLNIFPAIRLARTKIYTIIKKNLNNKKYIFTTLFKT